ncbi:Gcd10p family protein [Theileria parva strain Muguga]|uniref:Gcd10p family protein n=1 Tax=Theileria parva strain Muguga TaxID=333668 RepID=UPI001C621323|nr:Gcd10p family protein [Theileria parva strain Muguga]EAN34025.2 Gcd10p family protein [Theileria parva strain Muguga]
MINRYSYDPSRPICENDHVLLIDHIKRCFVVKVERNKLIKICKDKFKVDTLIGLNYGQIFTKVNNEWIKVNRNDETYKGYWNLLEQDFDDSDALESPISSDNRTFLDLNSSQKLSADDINKLKKDINPSELISKIVQNSETFQARNQISKEKYIKRKEFRHLKLFEVGHCNLMSICESYFNGFPHKIGYMRFESLAMMLHMSNVQFDDRIVVFDHSLGIITGAIAQRLQGTGKIYRLVTRGVSDKIVHELGVNNFDNILSIDFNEVMTFCNGATVQLKTSTLDIVGNDEVDSDDGSSNSTEEVVELKSKKRKKETLPGIYPLTKITESDLQDVDVVIGNVSFNKCNKDNSLVDTYTISLMEIANKFLKNDGRFIIFGQHFQPLSHCYSVLTKSSEYINVKLDETFIREYQVKPMCTHPIIGKYRPCCGFILSSIKVSNATL